jgi:hypothetical protein
MVHPLQRIERNGNLEKQHALRGMALLALLLAVGVSAAGCAVQSRAPEVTWILSGAS